MGDAITLRSPAPRETARMEIVCPRCATPTEVEFYAPCDSCRAELRATMGTDGTASGAGEYEPKMNVTPNAVALKDD